MKRKAHIGLLALLLLLHAGIFSQELQRKVMDMAAFEQLAKTDAQYEQSLQSLNGTDEADFWTDQKNFEKALKKRNYTAYQGYLKGKRDAYLEHELHCSTHCKHDAQYYLQAAFYYQYGKSKTSYSSAFLGDKAGKPAEISAVSKKKFQ